METTGSDTPQIRNPHVLKPTKLSKRPQRAIFFDTETRQKSIILNEVKQVLKMGYAAFYSAKGQPDLTKKSECEFYDISTFWEWIDKTCTSRTTTYLVAHNIVFDLMILDAFRQLPARGWELQSLYSKGMVSLFRWHKNGSYLYGQDNTNLFAGTLEYWGDLFDIPKIEINFDNASMDELVIYCRRDVDIMVSCWRNWMKFIDDNKCGSFKPTIASTAFGAWRHRFMPCTVYIHSDKLSLELERESYRGGRTECKFVGNPGPGLYHYLDINNMYGYVLQKYDFPAGHWNSSEKCSLWHLAYKLQRYCVTARVTIDIGENVFPMKINKHTAYPLGEFTTTLTTPELKYCINKGWLKEVHAYSWYRKAPLFEEYVTEFRGLREKYQAAGNKGYEKIVKMLINGLYGKFGQRGMDQEKIGDCDPETMMREQVYDTVDDEYYELIYLAGTIFRERHRGEANNSFPAIAAHVTAYARLYLAWFMSKVPAGHLFYVDTDSLIVDQVGYDCLVDYIDPGAIGKLKVECQSPWLSIRAPKDYEMEGRIKMKGIKKTAVKIDEGSYTQWEWQGLHGLMKKTNFGEYAIKRVTKRRGSKIWSGVVTPSGWVDPFWLGNSRHRSFDYFSLPSSRSVLVDQS